MKKQEVTIKLIHDGKRKSPVHMHIESIPRMNISQFNIGDNAYIHDLMLQFVKMFSKYIKKNKLYD